MHTPELMTTSQVAQRLAVDVRTVHRLAASQRLTPVVKGPGLRGLYLFDRAEVEAMASNREKESA